MGECFANSLSSSAKQQISDEFGQNISVIQSQNAYYTINGILEYLQSEWAKMEMERSQWEVERAELQTRIAFLQGECKGQENLKNDLVRRIKMLEYALIQERNKNFELKYPSEKKTELQNMGSFNVIESEIDSIIPKFEDDNARWREEKFRLREYLVNIGLGDAMSQLRNERVCDILGLKFNDTENASLNDERLIGSSTKETESVSAQSSLDPSSLELDQLTSDKNLQLNTTVSSPGFPAENEGTEASSSGFEDALDISDPETADALAEFEMLVAQQTALDKRLVVDVGQSGMSPSSKSPISIPKDWDSMDQKELLSRFKEQYRADRSKASQLRNSSHSGPKPYLDHHDLLDGSELDIDFPGSPMDPGDIDVKRPPSTSNLNLSTNDALMSDELDGIPPEFDVLINEQRSSATSPSDILKSPPTQKSSKHMNSGSVTTPFGLGDLASLTVANESDSGHARAVAVAMDNLDGVGDFIVGRSQASDIGPPQSVNKTSQRVQKSPPWTAKYTLRSHFDSIRSISFHPSEPILVTASEDHTLKLWNLNKTVQAKKSTSFDVESVYTFRGHNSPVLSLALLAHGPMTKPDSSSTSSTSSITVFSGDLNGQLRAWRLPSLHLDPYDTFDPGVLGPILRGHTDAIWSLAVRSDGILLSASADGTARLWHTGTVFESPNTSLNVYQLTTSLMASNVLKSDDFFSHAPVPTSIAFMPTHQSQFTVGFTSGQIGVFDMETSQLVTRFHATPGKTDPSTNVPDAPAVAAVVAGKPNGHVGSVMCVATHPNYPVVIGAHEDRQIRFYDPTSGKCVHSMVAHLDAVTSLSIDPQGLFLLSASHDCSIRLWDINTKTCVQEITSHRKKFGESINAVAFHPTKHFMASAGSDALAKVFV